jgi:hypothetical protein
MAQIIKHRRGSLESVASATKRAGELLVVTGSAGITAANGNSILFVGIDGSTVTPANKILQGTSVPNLSGASYDTSIDGLPYYDTAAQKLYILNKGGNVEVKATANTGGTGIVSGSSQVISLLPTGTISGSSQVDATQTTNWGTGIKTELNSNTVVSGSSQVDITATTGYTTFSSSLATSISASVAGATWANLNGKPSGIVSGSEQVVGILAPLNAFSASQITKNSTLATYTASLDTKNSTLATLTASYDSRLNQLEINSGSQASQLSNLESFTGSQVTKNSTLSTYTASIDSKLSAIGTYTSSLITAFTASGTNVTFNNDVTVKGNLFVQGTQTIVDSTTIAIGDNILSLNAAGTSDGGLIVRDSVGGSTISGSLLWDVTNDYWKVGTSGSESRILTAGGMDVVSGSAQIKSLLPSGTVSGSSQVDITSTTGYTTFSSSLASSISASVAGATWANLNGKPSDIVSSSAQTVANLVGQNISVAGISGSSLNITGNAKIDGNVIIGGNITIGDQTTDTVSFGADLTSNIIPSSSNTYNLGSNSNLFASVYATNVYGAINSTNGVVSGSSQVSYTGLSNIPVGIVSGSSQITSLLPTGVISGSHQLDTSSIDALTLTNVSASGSFSGSFKGDGSQLTGLVSTLALSGSTGNDSINLKTEALLVTGSNSISAAVTNNTITITAADATTSSKGVASFSSTNFDVTSGNVAIKANGVTAATLNTDVAGTGLSLNGGDNSLQVEYGATSGTAVEGNTSLTVQGTTGEIEVSGGSITLGNGGTVTIGLPDNVTISGSLQAKGDVTLGTSVSSSVTIKGNLFVQGTTTTVDSTTISLGDNILELNGTGTANGGLLVRDTTGVSTTSGSLLWDTTNDYWKAGKLGSEKEIVRFNTTPTSGSVQVIGANGLLVDSQITDDGAKVTVGTDLVINGLTAGSFIVSNGSKKLISVTPSNAGDMIQWNGSSFVASNEIDGGTF